MMFIAKIGNIDGPLMAACGSCSFFTLFFCGELGSCSTVPVCFRLNATLFGCRYYLGEHTSFYLV
jgi:hypothetical protein